MDKNLLRDLKDIKNDIRAGKIATSGELTNRVLSAFSESEAGLTLPRFVPSEPPISSKVNFLTRRLESMLRDKEYMFDLIHAASAFEYDEAMKALDSLEDKVAGLGDTVRTLYFYSKPFRSNVHSVGADFTNSWGLFKNKSNTMHLNISGGITLPVTRSNATNGTISVEGDGMSGSWYIVGAEDVLVADSAQNIKYSNLLDSNPTTLFEYGRYRLSQTQSELTKNLGWGFSDTEFKWASTEYDGVNVTITFSSSQKIDSNYIAIQPSVTSNQFKVNSVSLYLGDQVQRTLEPEDIIVNQELMMRYESGYVNSVVFIFEPTLTDKIVFKLSSDYPSSTKVRHFYSVDSTGERIAGETPSIQYPHKYLRSGINNETFKNEDLFLDRFYIGLKDIVIQSNIYGTEGVASTPAAIEFDKPIDRIGLSSDFTNPDNCKLIFEVSFDGSKWYNINPLGTSVLNQVIAINDRMPNEYRDPSTQYISLEENPKSFFGRITAERKSGNEYVSPIVRNIQFEVMLKD